MLTKKFLKEIFSTGQKPSGADFERLIDGTPRNKDVFVATEGQTVFNLTRTYTLNNNQIQVVVGGVPQFSPENFTETSTTSLAFKEGLPSGMDVVVVYYE